MHKHTATAMTRHESTMQVPAAHITLVRDSKQAMATTSTLLRYTIVVAPEVDAEVDAVAVAVAVSQGPPSVTLQVANCLRTLDGVEEMKPGKPGLS